MAYKKKWMVIVVIATLIALLPSVSAHCPLCTTGAAVSVGVARSYGVDDSIVGVFLGGFIGSSVLWFNKWFKKKVNFPLQEPAIMFASFLMFAIPFYYAGLINNFMAVKSNPAHYSLLGMGVFGVDKLLFGMLLGTLVLWGVFKLSEAIKKKRGKVLLPYQGLVFMAVTLLCLNLFLLMLTS